MPTAMTSYLRSHFMYFTQTYTYYLRESKYTWLTSKVARQTRSLDDFAFSLGQ